MVLIRVAEHPHGVFSPAATRDSGFVFHCGRSGDSAVSPGYGMKHIDQATFREEIDCLTARLRPTVTDAVSDPPAHWAGGRGYVDVDMLRRHLPTNYQALQYFIYGPHVTKDERGGALHGVRVACKRVHTDRSNCK